MSGFQIQSYILPTIKITRVVKVPNVGNLNSKWFDFEDMILKNVMWPKNNCNVAAVCEHLQDWFYFWLSLSDHVNVVFFQSFINNSDTIEPTGSDNSWEVFSLKEKQVFFDFKGLHDVLLQSIWKSWHFVNGFLVDQMVSTWSKFLIHMI